MRGGTYITLSFYLLIAFALVQAVSGQPVAAWTLFGCSQIVFALRLILEAIERP